MKTSETITELSKALTEFSAEIKDPRREASNPHFKSKYVSLDALVATIRPCLAKHGLSLMQSGGGDGQVITVTTRIQHISGEWIESDPLPLKADKLTPQGAGSAMTYGRRYSLSAMLNLAWDDNDDDGEVADGRGGAENYLPPSQPSPQDEMKEYLKKAMQRFGVTSKMMPKIIAEATDHAEPTPKWDDLPEDRQMFIITTLGTLKTKAGF